MCESDCLKTHVTAELTAELVIAVRAHYLKSDFRLKSLECDSIQDDLGLTPYTMSAQLTIELVTAELIH